MYLIRYCPICRRETPHDVVVDKDCVWASCMVCKNHVRLPKDSVLT